MFRYANATFMQYIPSLQRSDYNVINVVSAFTIVGILKRKEWFKMHGVNI
jgi:hypothetical protein